MSKLDYCFSNDYMVLRPNRAGPFDLLHLLFSPKVGRNRAVDCFTSTEIRSFGRRLALFLNLLLQVLLLSLAAPVAALGTAVEFALNLIDNLLQGRMEYPDRSSATYRSITGFIDQRVDLEGDIKPADSRYHAALCVMASKVAYENEAFIRDVVTRHWQMEFVKFYNCWNERVHGAGVRVLRQGGAGRGAGGGGIPRDAAVRRGAVVRRPGPVVVQGAAAGARACRLHAHARRAAQHRLAQVGRARQGQAPEGLRVLHDPRRGEGVAGGEREGKAAGDGARVRRRAGGAVPGDPGVPQGEGGAGPAGRGVHVRAAAGRRRHARHVRGAEPGQAQEAPLPYHLRRRLAAAPAQRRLRRPLPALRPRPPLRQLLQAQGAQGDTRRGEVVLAAGLRDEPHQLGVGARARRLPGVLEERLLPGRVGAGADEGAGAGAARPAVPQGAGLCQCRRAERLHSQGELTSQIEFRAQLLIACRDSQPDLEGHDQLHRSIKLCTVYAI